MFSLFKDFLLLLFNLLLSVAILFGLFILFGSIMPESWIVLAILFISPIGILTSFVLAFILWLIELYLWDKGTRKPQQAATTPELLLKPVALPKRSRKSRNKNP